MIVVGTRDCSLQRRYQKLVEEAPAPFLTDDQRDRIHSAARAICRGGRLPRRRHGGIPGRPGRHRCRSSRSTPDCRWSTRSRRRPAGIDLVREQFRIADGEKLRCHRGSRRRAGIPSSSGSTARTPAADSCPRPGTRHPFVRAGRSGCAGRFRGGVRIGDLRVVRLAAGQADRHRRRPAAGPRTLPPGAGRVAGRGHGHRAAVPPRRAGRPGVHRAPTVPSTCTPGGSRPSSSTPSSRSPVIRRRRPDRAIRGRRSSPRSTGAGSTVTPARRVRGTAGGPRRRQTGPAPGPRRAMPRPLPAAMPSPPRCRAPWSRSRSPSATRCRPATSSPSSRR